MKTAWYVLSSILSFATICPAWAQTDSTEQTFTFVQVQERVIQQNLSIIAAHYEIDAAQAQVIQAKLWPNIYFIWNQDMYSNETNQYFNYGNQRLIQFELTFSIAGRYRNNIKLARQNVELNRLTVEDIMRCLVYDASIQFTNLQSLQQKAQLYQTILTQFDQVIKVAENQVKLGAMAGNELTRLRSEYLEIQTVLQELKGEIEDYSGKLRILMAMPGNIKINTIPRTRPLVENVSTKELILLAKDLRPDYKLKEETIAYNKQNLKLQKSLAVPDVKLAYQPNDKGSNYVRPYQGFNVEMFLPIFNRNQGGVKEAKVRIQQSEVNFKSMEQQLEQEVYTAFNQFQIEKEGLNRYTPEFVAEMEQLNANAQTNYNRRTISLLEFIDLQRIYVLTKIQQLELLNKYLQAVNTLNFSVGRSVIE